jgi:hypothetical protein
MTVDSKGDAGWREIAGDYSVGNQETEVKSREESPQNLQTPHGEFEEVTPAEARCPNYIDVMEKNDCIMRITCNKFNTMNLL